jgi:hypothetical protein
MPDPNMEVLPAERRELVLLEPSAMTDALMLIEENLGNQEFSILSLPKIKVGSGGAIILRVETASGEETEKKLTGTIVAARSIRLYYKPGAVSKRPPDCNSKDGFTGEGDPGGDCRKCPFARWGTAIDATGSPAPGQACKSVKQVLFLLPDQNLPHVMNVPPTSLKAFDQYMLSLTSLGVPYWGALTELNLEKATSEKKIDYARLIFRLKRKLEVKEQQILRPYHQRMKEILTPSIVDASAYEVEEERPKPNVIQSAPRRWTQPLTPPMKASAAPPPPEEPASEAEPPETEDPIPF